MPVQVMCDCGTQFICDASGPPVPCPECGRTIATLARSDAGAPEDSAEMLVAD